jgi:hypothetical protein
VSYAPQTIYAVRAYLQPKTGLSASALGIVGDAAHQRRASYHNGQDAISKYGRTASTDYSIRTVRDREPYLTNAASALDIGTPTAAKGGATLLRNMSMKLVAQARVNAPGTRDIREIIFSPDGRRVLRWDRERGYTSMPREGEADDSHLWHTHIAWYRDSESRSKLAPFRRIFEPQTFNYWAPEIADDIKKAYPTGYTVAMKLKALGIAYGSHLNYADLEAGCRKRGIDYGSSVQLIDVRALMQSGTGPL